MLMACDASISLWFSSDLSLSSILISLLSRSRIRGPACRLLVRQRGWSLFSKASLYDSVYTAESVAPAGLVLLRITPPWIAAVCAISAQLKQWGALRENR